MVTMETMVFPKKNLIGLLVGKHVFSDQFLWHKYVKRELMGKANEEEREKATVV